MGSVARRASPARRSLIGLRLSASPCWPYGRRERSHAVQRTIEHRLRGELAMKAQFELAVIAAATRIDPVALENFITGKGDGLPASELNRLAKHMMLGRYMTGDARHG